MNNHVETSPETIRLVAILLKHFEEDLVLDNSSSKEDKYLNSHVEFKTQASILKNLPVKRPQLSIFQKYGSIVIPGDILDRAFFSGRFPNTAISRLTDAIMRGYKACEIPNDEFAAPLRVTPSILRALNSDISANAKRTLLLFIMISWEQGRLFCAGSPVEFFDDGGLERGGMWPANAPKGLRELILRGMVSVKYSYKWGSVYKFNQNPRRWAIKGTARKAELARQLSKTLRI